MKVENCRNRCCALLRALKPGAHIKSFYRRFWKTSKSAKNMTQEHFNQIGFSFEATDSQGQLTGKKFTCSGGNICPLNYADLLKQEAGKPGKLHIAWNDAIVLESDYAEAKPGETASFETQLNSNFSCNTFCLVDHGWLPLGLALHTDTILLLDNGTTTRLNPSKSDNRTHPDFIDFLQDLPVRINPSLYALEGSKRSELTDVEITDRLTEAYKKIATQLPNAIPFPKDMSGLQGVIGILKESSVGFAKKQQFLMKVAPKINGEVSGKRKIGLWNEILEHAAQHDIHTDSLIMVLLLSMVSVQKKSPGYKIIRPGQHYTSENAYNALSDLRALDIYMNMRSFYPNEKIAFCTNDKNLALFWAGIRPSGFVREGDQGRFTLNPIEDVLSSRDLNSFRTLFNKS